MTVGRLPADTSTPATALEARRILGVRIDACSETSAVDAMTGWAGRGESRVVAVANVHSVMVAREDPSFAAALEQADLASPDGMPLVWGLRRLGVPAASRVYGPDLMRALCQRAQRDAIAIGLYGGTPRSLDLLTQALRDAYPRLQIAYAWSPPFRPLEPEEDAETTAAIVASGARIVFVGIGCPKQEVWMEHHRGRIPAVLVGVGAAFDFLSGTKRQAPRWMMRAGLEWVFRLASEPRRLWRRYLRHNPRFVAAFTAQVLRERLQAVPERSDTSEAAPEVRASFPTGG